MEYPRISSPCKDCKERFDSCHSVCPKYLEFAAYRKMISEQKLKESRGFPRFKKHIKK